MRAWGFEKKLEEGEGGELSRLCWEEMKGRFKRGKVLEGWEKEREQFFGERGWTVEEVERGRERGEEIVDRGKKDAGGGEVGEDWRIEV